MPYRILQTKAANTQIDHPWLKTNLFSVLRKQAMVLSMVSLGPKWHGHIFRVYGNILPAYAGYCRKHMYHNRTQSNDMILAKDKVIKYRVTCFCFGKSTKLQTLYLEESYSRNMHFHWSNSHPSSPTADGGGCSSPIP